MTQSLTNLTPREAVADCLRRCLLGIDTNDRTLFESSCWKDDSIVLIAGPINAIGWNTVGKAFDRVFELTTTHFLTNERIEVKDENTAHMTCHCMAFHVKLGEELKPEDTSYTAGCLYSIDLVKDSADGLWKMKKWQIKIQWTTGDIGILHGPTN